MPMKPIRPTGDPTWRAGRRAAAEGEEIGHAPMLSDLAVAHAHDIDSLELNFATRRRRAQEFSPVGPVIGLVRCHAVAIGDLPMDVGVKVGKAARSTRYNSLAPRPPLPLRSNC